MHVRKEMSRLAALLILITCTLSLCSAENNQTTAEVPVEVPITSDDDSEQELSSQLQEVDSRSGGWSSWSEWSSCSRSCDGGVSHQLRTCRTGSCRGDHVRYKICNMQCVAVLVALVAAANASIIGLGGGILGGGLDSAAVVAGPAGTVTRAGGLAIGGIPAIAAGPAIAAVPAVPLAAAQKALELSVPAGSGLEGQWIPDINEKLHDDGSYKPLLTGGL